MSKIKLPKIFRLRNLQSEDEFYKKIFTKNRKWNTASPGFDEKLRWCTIEKFLYFIEGYTAALSNESKKEILDVGCGRGWLSNICHRMATLLELNL